MSKAGLETATYLSLDVEGAEFIVLQTIDSNGRFPFSVVLVEASHYMKPKNAEVRKLLLKAGIVMMVMMVTTTRSAPILVLSRLTMRSAPALAATSSSGATRKRSTT